MISVCIATYNGAPYICQQLRSIISQLSRGDEIIISDDGSTDGTIAAIVHGLGVSDEGTSSGKERLFSIDGVSLIIIDGPGRHSATLNFECALQRASGDYIFLSDQDDVWLADKVETCMKWLARYDCVVHDAEMTDRQLNVTDTSYYKVHGTRQSRLWNLLMKNGYMGCCMAFTRRVLQASLPFPRDIPMHDIWIGNIAAWRYSLRFIPDKLTLFRCHGTNTSFTARKKSGNSVFKMFMIRWRTVKNLVAFSRGRRQ